MFRRDDEKPVRGFIGQQNDAFRICREHGRRAAFHQHLQLLFGLASGLDLALDLPCVQKRCLAAADHLVNEQAHAEKCGEDQDVARDSGRRKPVETVE